MAAHQAHHRRKEREDGSRSPSKEIRAIQEEGGKVETASFRFPLKRGEKVLWLIETCEKGKEKEGWFAFKRERRERTRLKLSYYRRRALALGDLRQGRGKKKSLCAKKKKGKNTVL